MLADVTPVNFAMSPEDYTDLEAQLTDELIAILATLTNGASLLADLQPPTSILTAAARVAAGVFLAFERGYQME